MVAGQGSHWLLGMSSVVSAKCLGVLSIEERLIMLIGSHATILENDGQEIALYLVMVYESILLSVFLVLSLRQERVILPTSSSVLIYICFSLVGEVYLKSSIVFFPSLLLLLLLLFLVYYILALAS